MRFQLEAHFEFMCSAIWRTPWPNFFKPPFSVSHKLYQIFVNAKAKKL